MPIRTILVALALHGDSERVAGRAVQLANQHQANLVCVHIIEGLEMWSSGRPANVDAPTLLHRIKDQCRVQIGRLLVGAQRPPTIEVESGDPASIIGSMALSCQADVIVIGPGAPGNFREKVFGSTADRLIRSAPCPTLVVRENASAPYRHIAIGVDFSAHAQAAALWAFRLSPGALRELVHAFEVPLEFEQAMHKAGTSQTQIDQYRDARSKSLRQQILEMYGKNGRLPEAMRTKILVGDPAITLIRISRRKQVDLVALGTQGANAVAQHVLGSVARKVLAEAERDVLIVPSTAIQGRVAEHDHIGS